jgi:transposase
MRCSLHDLRRRFHPLVSPRNFAPQPSPERNPDELVWKHVKADTGGRSAIQTYDYFKEKVKSSTHSLQRNTKKLRSFFENDTLK